MLKDKPKFYLVFCVLVIASAVLSFGSMLTSKDIGFSDIIYNTFGICTAIFLLMQKKIGYTFQCIYNIFGILSGIATFGIGVMFSLLGVSTELIGSLGATAAAELGKFAETSDVNALSGLVFVFAIIIAILGIAKIVYHTCALNYFKKRREMFVN